MKSIITITVVVLVAVIAAWSAYAYTQGSEPLKQIDTTICEPVCEPATQLCEKDCGCHDGSDCVCDTADCPKFQDDDGDGECDVTGDCGYHDGSDCVCDTADCPKFQDEDGDGKCDVAGDCGCNGRFGCHDGASCCGGRMARGHGRHHCR